MNTSMRVRLLEDIESHRARIGVVGLGYVGLPFAVEKAKVGFEVVGVEENPVRAARVNSGDSYIADVSGVELAELVAAGRLRAQVNFDGLEELDVIVVCVPTPLDAHLTPDLSHVEAVTRQVAGRLRPGQLVSLESTTYPGTTDDLMRPILEAASGLRQGVDFFLCHSPERVDPGNKRYTTRNTSKVVGASDPVSLEVAIRFYEETIERVVPVGSAKAAEMTKVFENTFRAVNIALVNELALLCDRIGLDVWEVLDAANTKPFGMMPFYPGPGVGGHCIPIDPHYLEWKAREHNFTTRFIGLAGEINRRMPEFVLEKARRILNSAGTAPSQARVLVIGAAYKRDLGDWRESPAVVVMELLLAEGASVDYHDPFVPSVLVSGRELRSVELAPGGVAAYNLVIIATDHSTVDYDALVLNAQAVLDTRGVTRKTHADDRKVHLL